LREAERLVDKGALASDHAPPVVPSTHSLRDRKRQCFERRHGGKKLVDLKRAGETPLNPRLGSEPCDVFSF
jgi:hypothetical protein